MSVEAGVCITCLRNKGEWHDWPVREENSDGVRGTRLCKVLCPGASGERGTKESCDLIHLKHYFHCCGEISGVAEYTKTEAVMIWVGCGKSLEQADNGRDGKKGWVLNVFGR